RAWVKDHVVELKGKMPDFLLARLAGVVESICDTDERDASARLFGDELRGTEGAERSLERALEAADVCIELRGREGEKLKKRLGAADAAAGQKGK
ncbi:MAG: hypothetical protein ABI134_19300, partial [Byssovorax sp.]